MTFLRNRLARTAALIVAAGFVAHAASDGNLAVNVTDASGKMLLSGATVIITSPTQIGGAKTATTDASGKVRFPRLSPGSFKVVVSAVGFNSQTVSNVDVLVDQTAAVNIKLAPVGATTVEVVGTAAQIDVTTVTQGMQIDQQQLETLPMGRTQLSALVLAPGVISNGTGNPALLTALNRDNFGTNGARNNSYMIDGIDVTSPEAGTGRTNIAPELVQVQDVKTGAITAEYTARAGLFSNTTTKVGGNEFSGGLSATLRPSSLQNNIAPGRIAIGESQTSDFTIWGLGPIIKDKLWYVISYQKAKAETTVALASTATTNPGEKRTGVDFDGHSIFTKLTWQITPSDIADLTFNSDPSSFDNLSAPGTLTGRALKTERGGSRFLAHYGHTWSNVFLDIRLAQHKEDNISIANSTANGPQNTIRSANAITPLASQLGNSSASDKRTYQKDRLRVDATWLFDAMGSHTLKGGFEQGVDKLTQTVGVGQGDSYESFDVGTYTWGNLPSSQAKSQRARALNTINNTPTLLANFIAAGFTPTLAGKFQSTDLNSYTFNEANPLGGFFEYRLHQVSVASSSPKMEISGLYAQDQWQIGRFTFSPGVRMDKYTYKADNGTELFKTSFNVAPRVGLTYDVFGNGKSKAYAYWGRYIDPIKLDMVRFTGSLSSSERSEDIRMRNQWILLIARGGTKAVDAVFADNFKLPKTDEMRLGFSTEFANHYTFDATWSHRKDFDIVEDWDPTVYGDPDALEGEARALFHIGATPSAKEQQVINAFRNLALPLSYFSGGGYTGAQNLARVQGGTLNFILANLPGGERKYTTLDLTLNRKEANNWGGFMSASFVNATGNSFSSGNADYQGDLSQYDPRLPYMNGKLDGSVDWMFKANAFYRFDMGLMIGGTFNANSGYHYSVSDLVGTRILNQAPSIDKWQNQIAGQKMSPRTYQTDVRVQYGRKLGSMVRGEVFLDVFNFFNNQDPTGLSEGLNVRTVAPLADQPYAYQAPRAYQLGFRLKF